MRGDENPPPIQMTLNPAIVCFYSYHFTKFRRYRLFLLLSFYKVLTSRTGSLLNLIMGFSIMPHMGFCKHIRGGIGRAISGLILVDGGYYGYIGILMDL